MVDAPHGMCARRLVDVANPRIDRHPLGKRLDVTRADWFIGPGAHHCLVAADVEEHADFEPIVPRLTALEPIGGVGRLLRSRFLERAIEALLGGVGHLRTAFRARSSSASRMIAMARRTRTGSRRR